MKKIDVNDIVGKHFGRLTVLKFHHKQPMNKIKGFYYYYLCECECGNKTIVIRSSLINGYTQSCGCLCNETRKSHELIHHPLYKKWAGMKYRCYNPKCKYYDCYGARGIKICDEWLNDFMAFYNWAIKNGYKKGLTIDRTNVNGNYCPKNCRWVTDKVQANNRTNNRLLTFKGKTKTVAEWSILTNLTQSAIYHRLERGWSIRKTLTTPQRNKP